MRDTTEGLNLVAYAWGRKHLRRGDVVVATEMEHHSNLVPWQFLANQTGALMRYVKVDDDGALDLESLERAAADGPVRLVAAVHVSNSLGTVNPIEELGAWCRAHDAVLVVDGAQSAPHRPIDVQALGVDFFAFSGHKLGGPGSGALYGREERLDEMDPFLTGGEMISRVTLERHELERPAVQVRGGHARDRREHRARRRHRLPDGRRHRGGRAATSTS